MDKVRNEIIRGTTQVEPLEDKLRKTIDGWDRGGTVGIFVRACPKERRGILVGQRCGWRSMLVAVRGHGGNWSEDNVRQRRTTCCGDL